MHVRDQPVAQTKTLPAGVFVLIGFLVEDYCLGGYDAVRFQPHLNILLSDSHIAADLDMGDLSLLYQVVNLRFGQL